MSTEHHPEAWEEEMVRDQEGRKVCLEGGEDSPFSFGFGFGSGSGS